MKPYLLTLGVFSLLFSAAIPITATPIQHGIQLPSELVTMSAIYGENSWFTMTLSDIPPEFDVTNGVYQGWCVQKTIYMTQHVNHAVFLFSSNSASLPGVFQNINWEKINYILNHKHGNRNSIQKAIWHYSNNEDCSMDPDAALMVKNAEQYGNDFVPITGDRIAIPVQGVPTIQLTFIELTVPPTGVVKSVPSSHPHNHPPTADATAGEPYKGFINKIITFDGSRSYDRDGQITSWLWTFGDGTSGTGERVGHAYILPGDYTVTLTVKDNWFAPDTYTTTAHVTIGNNPPSTPVISGTLVGHTNTSYQYTMTSTDSDGDMLRYFIDWGDGTQNTTQSSVSGQAITVSHLWHSLGFYVIRSYARDPYNANSTVRQITISVDVHFVGNLGYLMNIDGIGPFDMFYSNETKNQTGVHEQNTNEYLIDTNGDGSYDHVYNIQTGDLRTYPETLGAVYVMLLVGVGFIILLVIILSLLMKRKKTVTKQ